MGATADGVKELIGITDGYRESEQSWAERCVFATAAPKAAAAARRA